MVFYVLNSKYYEVDIKQKFNNFRCLSISAQKSKGTSKLINISDKEYICDNYTNVTPKILSHIGKNLHNRKYHPLCLIKERIIKHFYKNCTGEKGKPVFSVYDNLYPVVTAVSYTHLDVYKRQL